MFFRGGCENLYYGDQYMRKGRGATHRFGAPLGIDILIFRYGLVIGCSLYTALVFRRVELPVCGVGIGERLVRFSIFYRRLSDICPIGWPLDVVRGICAAARF